MLLLHMLHKVTFTEALIQKQQSKFSGKPFIHIKWQLDKKKKKESTTKNYLVFPMRPFDGNCLKLMFCWKISKKKMYHSLFWGNGIKGHELLHKLSLRLLRELHLCMSFALLLHTTVSRVITKEMPTWNLDQVSTDLSPDLFYHNSWIEEKKKAIFRGQY